MKTASRLAFSFMDILIALAMVLIILTMIPVHKNIKKYHDAADDYVDHNNKKVIQDIYGSHR